MAIYHLSCQTIGRAQGRSAVAASAYRAGERLTDERTGEASDYTRRRDVSLARVVLPDGAPAEYADRSTLWTAAERAERGRNAQVAREFNAAIPIELTREQGEALALAFAESMAEEGMAADLAVHWKPENPHFHCMCTVRPLGPDGFGQKSVTEYLMRDRDGNERGASAKEAKELERAGWEKLYVYRIDGEDVQLTKSEAEDRGLDPIKSRKRKQPVQTTRYLTDWGEVESLERWRARWEDMANDALRRAGSSARIDRRSYVEQGIDREPTRHEGPAVRALEARGVDTEIGAINRAISARNDEADAELAALADARAEAEALTLPTITEEEASADVLALALASEGANVRIPARNRMELERAAAPTTAGRMGLEDARSEANDAIGAEASRSGRISVSEILMSAAEALRSYVARLLVIIQAVRREAMERGEDVTREEAAGLAIVRERDTPRPTRGASRARALAEEEDRQLELERTMGRRRQRDRSL